MTTKRRRSATIAQKTSQESSVAEDVNEGEDVAPEVLPNTGRVRPPDLKQLVFLGRLTGTVNIAGYKFELQTLTAREQRSLVERIMMLTETERFARVRDLTMAYALNSVNSVPLEELYTPEDGREMSAYDRKIEAISEWQSSLVDTLYNKYQELFEKASKDYEVDDLKV